MTVTLTGLADIDEASPDYAVISIGTVTIDGVERRVSLIEPVHGTVRKNLGLSEDAPAIRAYLRPKE